MLMRFDPFRDLDRLTQDLYRGEPTGRRMSVMPMDAYRKGDSFVVHFDLPGVDPTSIELTVEKNVLTVRAERSWRLDDATEVVVAERPQGSYSRQLFLGEMLDSDRIQATYDQGVLTVTIPVAEAAKPRRVQVTGGDSRAQAINADSTTA
jgi:HSP20 family protein